MNIRSINTTSKTIKSITKKRLILASQSPRRKELLEQSGVEFEILPADIEEYLMPLEMPEDYVKRLSQEKAQFIGQKYPAAWIIGADTTVVIDDKILEKPSSIEDAKNMLLMLSGKTHIVYTGFTLFYNNPPAPYYLLNASSSYENLPQSQSLTTSSSNFNDFTEKIITKSVKTEVLFRVLTQNEINWYVNSGEPFDKAGAYAIQGLGAFMVKSINGSYSNVVGLPVCEVLELLIQEKIVEMVY